MSGAEIRVCGRYRLESIIKKSEMRTVYLAKNVQTNDDVVIKSEQSKNRYSTTAYTLLHEGKVMQSLQGGIGIPSMHWCGQEEDYNFIVMELLGKNLQELFNLCKRKFSLKTVLMIGDQVIGILQYYHFKNYVYRSVKPTNFMIGLGKKNHKIFMIDYSTTKRYRDARTLEHIPFKQNGFNPDNIIFSGIAANGGAEPSRRDDIESVLYMLIYFLKGLPWYQTDLKNDEASFKNIHQLKKETPVEELCKGLPREFVTLVNYSRNIKFQEKPDYVYIKNIFRERMEREGYINDSIYDWVLIPPEISNSQDALYIPLTLEIIPNEDQFIRNHLEIYNKEIEENNENQDNEKIEAQRPVAPIIQKKQDKKDKECLLF